MSKIIETNLEDGVAAERRQTLRYEDIDDRPSGAEDAAPLTAEPVSFEEFEAQERQRRKRQAFITWSLLALATVVAPLSYLSLTGQFSTDNLARHRPASVRPARVDKLNIYGAEKPAKLSPKEQAHRDLVKSDLRDFVDHDLAAFAPEEKVAVIALTNVTGPQFKDEATTWRALRTDVIPAQERLVARASLVHPKTPEVETLSNLLLLSAKMRLVAYRQMLEGANDPDALWKYAFQADSSDAEQKARNFRTQLTELSLRMGVPLPL